ncbi:hypothetical protein WICPIJ_001066 [Wickerhamomyces pijperi]|uniref:Uncharacterized protein n=1 Tax=Wickerhamomyces pijperi TaxID=599730 RepID=A0A9P8TRN5_WICPI|nr:hypothetical protein WICPIJ_001066 [Wickerhamomyces pijperi]
MVSKLARTLSQSSLSGVANNSNDWFLISGEIFLTNLDLRANFSSERIFSSSTAISDSNSFTCSSVLKAD